MSGKSEYELETEVAALRKRLAHCEKAVKRHQLAEEKARNEITKLRALLLETRNKQASPGQKKRDSVAGPSKISGRTDSGVSSVAWSGQDTWIATIAHELKQPLTAIVNYTHACARLLESGQEERTEMLHALEQATRQAERAADMIQQLRRVASPGQARTAPMQMGPLCQEALLLLESELKAAQVQVELEIPDMLPAIRADAFQIRLVLLNLLRNAIEALAKSKLRLIRIAACKRDAEIEMSIRDTGGGLSLAMVHNLFEPHQTTKPDGMGLGLALCRAIVQEHGGRIWAKAHGSRGVTFYFTLPI